MAHSIKALLSHFDAAYTRKMGVPALISAKDAALAKRLLARYSLPQLCAWVDRFFVMPDSFIQESGFTFGVFSSCLGKVIAASQPEQVTVSAKMARSLKAIYGERE